jgi:hypothetical protein
VTPAVLIAANPYEAELCKKALVDVGVPVDNCDGIPSTVLRVRGGEVLVVIIADGWHEADARELLVEVRSSDDRVPIFLLADRNGDIIDEDAAIRRGASRLFLRPIDTAALADAVEKLAVEAELAGEVGAKLEAARDNGEPIEIEADYAEMEEIVEPAPVPRIPTEAMPPPPPPGRPNRITTTRLARLDDFPDLGDPLRVEPQPPPLMRADEAMPGDLSLELLSARPPVTSLPVQSGAPPAPVAVPPKAAQPSWLDKQLSEAEKRLFPNSPSSSTPLPYKDYDAALDDIDLDSLGLDTIPGISVEKLEKLERRASNGQPAPAAAPIPAAPTPPPAVTKTASLSSQGPAPLALPDEGELAEHDICELFCTLHTAGWTGRVEVSRGDGEKHVYFDGGQPVFATSTFVADRLGDMLYREGKMSRDQLARARELVVEPGRRTADRFVELGFLKSRELFPSLRRQTEEIIHSVFAWDKGRFKLVAEQAPAEERLRLSQHPWALFLEGVRRKYGFDRLVELVGSRDVVVHPTTNLAQAISEAGMGDAERQVAKALNDAGERALADLMRWIQIGEASLYALIWALECMGAVQLGDEERGGVRAAATVITPGVPSRERRQQRRIDVDVAGDAAVDRERVLAKRAQIDDADYFTILGVEADAGVHEIDRAYARLSRDFDITRVAPEVKSELGGELAEIALVLAEAKRLLSDDETRAAYRAELTAHGIL